MDDLTLLIRTEIKKQYKSIRQFSESIGIPQSTIVSALKNGIGGTAFDTVVKICETLNVKMIVGSKVYLDGEKREMLEMFSKLDDNGKHTVKTICKVEYMRCTDSENSR